LTENRTSRFFYGYAIVLATFFILVVTWGTLYCFGVFFKPVLTEFGWTRAATSGAYSLCLLLSGFFSIIAGRLSDKVGPRIAVTACGLLMGSGYLLMSQISAIWQLYLFYGVLVGMGLGCAYIPLGSTIARWFVKRRGLMTGIAVSGIGVGTMIMPPLANWLISNYGWRTSYIVSGITVLVLVILIAQFVKRDPSRVGLVPYVENGVKPESLHFKGGGFSLQRAIHTRQFWILCVIFLCFGFFLQSIIVHIVPHATDLAISPACAAYILAIIGGLSVAGRIVMGNAGDRIGNKIALTSCFSLMLVALLWLLAAEELWKFYLFATIFGFAYGGLVALLSPILAELFGLSSLGAILGVVTFSWSIGEAVGPALAGRLFDVTGSYELAFWACAALCIIAVILVLFLRPFTNAREGDAVSIS